MSVCISRPFAATAKAVLFLGLWQSLAVSAMTGAAAAATKAETRGKAFVALHCSQCHATGPTGASPNKSAPPLRDLSKRYPLENLEEAFAEGIVVNHGSETMPSFQLEPQSINDMIAYLKAIGK